MSENREIYKLYVRRIETNEIVRVIDISNKNRNRVDRVIRGLLINMNTDEFYVDDSEIPCDE